MSYEFIQSALTAAIELVAIVGFGSIALKTACFPTASAPAVESAPEVQAVTEVAQEVPAVEEPVAEPEASSTAEESLADINVDALTLRQTREVVKAINKTLDKDSKIRQKVNGADVPYRLLQAQIKRHLEQRPDSKALVAEVLKAA